MVQQTTSPEKEARKQAANRLAATIEETFDEVDSVIIDDAVPSTWECVALAVHVTGEPTPYWTSDAITQKTGALIDVNLRSFAPRLYNRLREDEDVSTIEVVRKPTVIDESRQENLYDGTLYLIDVWLY